MSVLNDAMEWLECCIDVGSVQFVVVVVAKPTQ